MCKIGIGGTHPSRTNDLSSCFGESYAIRLYFTACVLISWWWVSEICSYNLPNFNDSWRTAYRIMDIMKNNNQLYEQIVTSVFLWSMFRFFFTLSSCDILEHLYQCCMEPSLPWRSYMYGIIIIIIIQCREIVQTEYFFYIALTNSPAMIWQHELPTGVVCRVQHVYSSGITTLTFKSSNWYSKRWRQQNILPHILYPIYVNSDSETL